MLRQVESGIPADSRCCCPLLSVKCLLLCFSIFIFPRMAALTFSTEKLTVFRDSQGSAVLLCPVRKRCHERKVMSVPPGCLLNLRRHYFATQHDCIHIIPHPTKVAGTPLAWWPCARGPWRAGFNQRDRDPSAFSFDGQSNKAWSSMTHQSAHVRAGGEWRWRRLLRRWRRGANSRFRPPTQQRLTDLCPHTAALAEVTRGIAALISREDDNGCVLSLSDHQSQIRSSILQRDGGLLRVRSGFLFDSAAMTCQRLGYESDPGFDHIQDLMFPWHTE